MDALLRRRMMMAGGPPPSPLPAGYTPLTYVENSLGNSAYIKTGITASNTLGFHIDCLSNDELDTASFGCIFGGRYTSGSGDYQLSTYSATYGGVTWAGGIRTGEGSGANAHLPSKSRFVAELNGTQYSIEGANYSVTRNIPSGRGREIYLFALNNNGTVAQNGHVRVYRFWLTSGGTRVIDYYPCSRDQDGKVGFYDLVNNTFVPPFTGTLYGA